MILQALLGGIAGVLVAVKLYGRRIRSRILFWKHDDESSADEDKDKHSREVTEPE